MTSVSTQPDPATELPASPSAPVSAAPAYEPSTGDPNVPYYKFPDFPTVPEGVHITPFQQFVPRGIIVPVLAPRPPATTAGGTTATAEPSQEEEEEDELDGAGVPTVGLASTHDPFVEVHPDSTTPAAATSIKTSSGMANVILGGRKRKGKNWKKLPLGVDENGQQRRLTWWEKWEAEEDKKRGAITYNQNEDRSDRLDMAVKMFRKGHALEAGVQSIWDRFIDFIGMLRNENQMPSAAVGKKGGPAKGITRRNEEFSDDDFDDDVETMEELWEERLIRFLEDPTKALKRFFSSHYHEEGLYWSDAKLRDGPILVAFFLRYVIRERVLPEYERDVKAALKFLEEVIKPDLLSTRSFSIGAEDDFSRACVNDLGTLMLMDVSGWVPAEIVLARREQLDLELLARREEEARHEEEERKRLKEEFEKDGLMPIDDSTWGGASGWGERTWDEGNGAAGWGVNGTTQGEVDGESKGEPDPWSSVKRPTLSPSSIPLTHSLLRTERSVRRILSVRPADPTSPDILRQKYATVVFEPWPLPEDIKDTDILQPPEMLRVAEGEKEQRVMQMKGGAHTLKDNIELLVEPEHAERARPGLGVYAVWVQAGRTSDMPGAEGKVQEPGPTKELKTTTEKNADTAAAITDTKTEGAAAATVTTTNTTANKKKKKGGKGSSGPKAETFWFFQHVTIVIPSYWVE